MKKQLPPPLTNNSTTEKLKDFPSEIYDTSYESGGYQGGYHKHYTQVHYYPSWRQAINYMYLLDRSVSILEIACGVGQFANMLFDNGFTNYIGFDFSAKGIERAKATNPKYADRFFVSDAFKTDLLNKDYDLVICFEALEHIQDDLGLIKRIKKGTKVLMSVPNFPDTYHVRYFKTAQEVYDRYKEVINIFAIQISRMSPATLLYYIVGEKN